jgi:hypothetical protein
MLLIPSGVSTAARAPIAHAASNVGQSEIGNRILGDVLQRSSDVPE